MIALNRWIAGAALLAAVVCSQHTALGQADGKTADGKKAEAAPAPAADEASPPRPAAPDLGPPLVENPDQLKRLLPDQPVWIDKKLKQVAFLAEACKPGYNLEFLITNRDRAYESVLATQVKPSVVHTALLAVGARPGRPASFQPRFEPPSGTEVAIDLAWKDKQGKVQRVPAGQWVRNTKTKKSLEANWVFAGSQMVRDDETGKFYYRADGACDFISVLNLPSSTLDLAIRSEAGPPESRIYEADADKMPPEGTAVTVILKPKVEEKKTEKVEKKADSPAPKE